MIDLKIIVGAWIGGIIINSLIVVIAIYVMDHFL